jgi:hypothetical protein
MASAAIASTSGSIPKRTIHPPVVGPMADPALTVLAWWGIPSIRQLPVAALATIFALAGTLTCLVLPDAVDM